jgi:hypothetical protein
LVNVPRLPTPGNHALYWMAEAYKLSTLAPAPSDRWMNTWVPVWFVSTAR